MSRPDFGQMRAMAAAAAIANRNAVAAESSMSESSEASLPLHARAGTHCNVCGKARNNADWGWNSSGSVWCDSCKVAYNSYLADHPLPQGEPLHHPVFGIMHTALHLPAYMMLPDEWPTIGFTPDLLAPYRPGGPKYNPDDDWTLSTVPTDPRD